jgi:hypothetical protein
VKLKTTKVTHRQTEDAEYQRKHWNTNQWGIEICMLKGKLEMSVILRGLGTIMPNLTWLMMTVFIRMGCKCLKVEPKC